METETGLVVISQIGAVDIFTSNGLDPILKSIAAKVNEFVADVSTAKGRKEIAALAHKVAQSKTYLDGLGKDLVADWKEKAKLVDVSRKTARDFLDDLKVVARKPLTDWEAEEARKKAAEDLKIAIETAHEEALMENDLRDRQKAIEAKEKEIAEAERLKAEAAHKEALETERIRREAAIAKEAEEKAIKAAQEAVEAAKKAAIEAEIREKLAKEQAAKDKVMAEESARISLEFAEKERVAAAKKAEEEKALAVKAEAERIAKEQAETKRIADEKAKNIEHRRHINVEALESLESFGLATEIAKQLIAAIATGKIKHIHINY